MRRLWQPKRLGKKELRKSVVWVLWILPGCSNQYCINNSEKRRKNLSVFLLFLNFARISNDLMPECLWIAEISANIFYLAFFFHINTIKNACITNVRHLCIRMLYDERHFFYFIPLRFFVFSCRCVQNDLYSEKDGTSNISSKSLEMIPNEFNIVSTSRYVDGAETIFVEFFVFIR